LVARDLVNERADTINPQSVTEYASQLATQFGFSATVMNEAELRENGLNMLVAVGQAAEHTAALVELEWLHPSHSTTPGESLCIVGKGVTFDTGGLNLKPTGFIEDMHMDMGGAAATLGCAHVFGKALQAGSAPANPRFTRVAFVLALAENAIGSLAVKPNAVLTSHKGMTVQVGNTDAEGRLCLADAMSWVQRGAAEGSQGEGAASALRAAAPPPDVLIDVATLTGACVVALGEHTAGLFANDEALAADLVACGSVCSERLHPLPITPDHRDALKCEQADTNSIGGKVAGACTAAAFLEKFVAPGVKWAHLDIAGPAMCNVPHGITPKGGTGFAAASLAGFALSDAALKC